MIEEKNRARHAFALRVKDGRFNSFRSCLGRLWPDITALLDGIGAENFSLWQIGEELAFGYYETEGLPVLSRENEAGLDKILETVQENGEWISSPRQ